MFLLTDFKIAPVAGEIVATRLQCEEVKLFLYLKYYGTLQRIHPSVTKSYAWGRAGGIMVIFFHLKRKNYNRIFKVYIENRNIIQSNSVLKITVIANSRLQRTFFGPK